MREGRGEFASEERNAVVALADLELAGWLAGATLAHISLT